MTSKILINSPLEKGDKGGCEVKIEGERKETTPSAPFSKGEFFTKLLTLDDDRVGFIN